MQNLDDSRLSRRGFLRAAAAVGTLTFTSTLGRAARLSWSSVQPGGEGNLLLLQLTGGNDGLAMVVPFGDDAYHAARPTLARKRSEVLALDGYRGLHPELQSMRDAWEAGELAIVEGCGYPDPNRSHFKSMEIWHTADARGRAAGEGWIGRLSEVVWKEAAEVNRVIHVGEQVPYSMESKLHPCASFTMPEGYRWIDNEGGIAEYDKQTGGKRGGTLGALRRVLDDARLSSGAVRNAVSAYRPKAEYPQGTLGAALRSAAALFAGGIGTRIVSIEMGGFDTHNDERARHDRQMRDLDAALGAFRSDTAGSEAGKRTAVMAFSEFGRRVAENGSGGTDHGTAGPMFVIGAAVKGGLYGAHPSLVELDEGDLIHTTDFRSVYASVAAKLFDAPRGFLGRTYGELEL